MLNWLKSIFGFKKKDKIDAVDSTFTAPMELIVSEPEIIETPQEEIVEVEVEIEEPEERIKPDAKEDVIEIIQVKEPTLLELSKHKFYALHKLYMDREALYNRYLPDVQALSEIATPNRIKEEFANESYAFDRWLAYNGSALPTRLVEVYKELASLFRRSICEEYVLLYINGSRNKTMVDAIKFKENALLDEFLRY